MAKYRKRPVVIEAIRLPDIDCEAGDDVMDWLHEPTRVSQWTSERDGSIVIRTKEGEMRADPGDWLIQGVAGELYPCKPDIFVMTYEAV